MEKPRPRGTPAKPESKPAAKKGSPAGLEATQGLDDAEAAALEALGLTQGLDEQDGDATDAADLAVLGATEAPAAADTDDPDITINTDQPEAEAPPPPKPKAAPPPAKPAAGPEKVVTLGDFRLTKKLGEGGMGAVYKAHQISLDRDVALKVLGKHLASNQTFIQRFYREARIQAKLDHPHIVRGYWVGEFKGQHMFAMEYVDGGSVQAWLKKLGKFNVGDALHIILACADALHHAHEQNMIHRDIKPDNLLVTSKGVVKVADLGLAKALDDNLSLTQSGVGAGTPYYMAPEQAHSAKHVDGRTDIYAMGCMLYVFLTGELPFKGETTVEVIKAKETGKFAPTRRANEEVPEKLDLIIDKMLATKPERRYQTCAELTKDLEELALANDTLSFIANATATLSKPAVSSVKPKPAATTGPKPSVTAPPGAAPAPAAKTDAGIWWYVRFTTGGKMVTKKLTQQQAEQLIRSDSFDPATQASHSPTEGFKPIGAFKEFEHAVRGRFTKEKTEKKGQKFKGLMDEIDAQDRRRRRWKWLRNLLESVKGWIVLIIVLSMLALTGYLLWTFGPDMLAKIGIHVGGK